MKLETFLKLIPCSILHPLRALNVLYSYSLNREVVKKARHSSGKEIFVILPNVECIMLYMGIESEEDVNAFMREVIKPGMTVFDIGANTGYHSIGASSLILESGSVIAFEPVPYLHKLLELNFQHSNITLEKMAVSNGINYLELKYYGLKFSVSTTALEPRLRERRRRKLSAQENIGVKATSIDDYVANSGIIPNLMKIDIENGEMDALIGSSNTITSYRPYIIMEVGDRGRNPSNSTSACLSFLTKFMYSFYEFDRKNRVIVPHNLKEKYKENGNLLCVPDFIK